ncbi:MAG: flagellar filament capping protein FliD [Syntrophomonadaceae bacterium]
MANISSSTGTSSTLYSNRISGLASGMDTETMVKSLVDAQRKASVDPLSQKKQQVEWKREAYRATNTKLLALRNAAFDIKMKTTFMAKTVESGDSSVLTATAKAEALNGNYSIQVTQMAQGATKQSTPGNSDYVHAGGEKSFILKGKSGEATIYVSDGNTISDIVSKINAKTKDTGIQATYDADTNQFFLMTTATGVDAKIEITDTDNIMSSVFNMADLSPTTGQDAIIKFNGGSDVSFSSNTFTFNNINFSLKKAGTTTVTVNNDVDAAVDKIKAFVEAYNTAIEDISGKLSEDRDRDYEPLTDAQKEEMSDSEIENWEAKAKSGMLRGDTLLSSVYSNLRMTASNIVSGLDGDYTTLYSVGISTNNYTEKGKLHIDEDKLRAALADDPEGVMNMFTQTSNTQDEKGIAVQLYEQLNSNITTITNTAGSDTVSYDQSALGKQIIELKDDIETAEEKLSDKQEYWWNQFTVMEQYIQQMNEQCSWLQAQLGSSS